MSAEVSLQLSLPALTFATGNPSTPNSALTPLGERTPRTPGVRYSGRLSLLRNTPKTNPASPRGDENVAANASPNRSLAPRLARKESSNCSPERAGVSGCKTSNLAGTPSPTKPSRHDARRGSAPAALEARERESFGPRAGGSASPSRRLPAFAGSLVGTSHVTLDGDGLFPLEEFHLDPPLLRAPDSTASATRPSHPPRRASVAAKVVPRSLWAPAPPGTQRETTILVLGEHDSGATALTSSFLHAPLDLSHRPHGGRTVVEWPPGSRAFAAVNLRLGRRPSDFSKTMLTQATCVIFATQAKSFDGEALQQWSRQLEAARRFLGLAPLPVCVALTKCDDASGPGPAAPTGPPPVWAESWIQTSSFTGRGVQDVLASALRASFGSQTKPQESATSAPVLLDNQSAERFRIAGAEALVLKVVRDETRKEAEQRRKSMKRSNSSSSCLQM